MYRIHGGSFDSGSASAPGLSGARIAQEGNIVVVVLQYRLGVLGYLPPSSDPNLGVGDIVLALRWLRNAAKDFGGDGGRVVLGGQSSGAHMIRGRSYLSLEGSR
jgi:carboxylesterase type B